MILYHGTNQAFGDIDLAKSKPNKDFGQGFYLSREYTQAMDMAKIKVEQLETGVPTVLTYEADDTAMKQLKVLRFDDYSEEWAKFILLNRNNSVLQLPGKDEWYIVYHRINKNFIDHEPGIHREVCIDRLTFDRQGRIIPVTPTLDGPAPLPAK